MENVHKMKKQTIILGIIALLVLTPVIAQDLKEFGYFEDLAVTGDAYIAGHLRVDNNVHLYGELSIDDQQGYTGNCPYNAKHIYKSGILVDCRLPSREEVVVTNE